MVYRRAPFEVPNKLQAISFIPKLNFPVLAIIDVDLRDIIVKCL